MENTYHRKYVDNLSKGVEAMWLKQRYTDVTIKVAGKAYNCHRVLLGSLSGFFKDQFTQATHDVIELTDMDSAIFEIILQYIYTGSADKVKERVESVIQSASFLKIPCLLEQCEDILKVRLTPDTCVDIYQLARRLNCSSLSKQSWAYILEFFPTVIKANKITTLSIDDIIAIINDDDLNTPSEESVCDAVMRWISSEPQNRIHYLEKLFGYIRFPLISAAYTESLSKDAIVSKSETGKKILKEFGDYLSSGKSSGTVNPRQFHHRTEEMICGIGTRSRQPNPETTEIKCFSYNRESEYLLASLPVEPGACFAVCSSNNDLFLSGGYLGQQRILRYVSTENKWRVCASMAVGRWGHAMAQVDGIIYIFGGSKKIPETIASIEMYDPNTDMASAVGNLEIPVSFTSVATIRNKVYIFGGKLEDRNICRKVQCFDTKTKTCSTIGDMPVIDSTTSRVAVIDNTVFIFYSQGEVVKFREGEQPISVGSIPKYDHFGVVPKGGKILIDGIFGNQATTVMFDPVTYEVKPFTRTVKMALCNFYCINMVMSKNILQTC